MKKFIIISLITLTNQVHAIDLDEIITKHLEQDALQTRAPGSVVELVPQDKLHAHATNYFKTLVSSQGRSFNALPKTIQKRASETLKDITTALTKKLTKEKNTGLNRNSLESIINQALSSLIAQITHFIAAKEISQRVSTSIDALFEKYQLKESMVPAELKTEYETRKKVVLKKLNNHMQTGQQDYVLVQDIQGQVTQSLDKFMVRMQYVLFGKWTRSYVADIKKKTPGKTPSSSIPVSDETKKMYRSLAFIETFKKKRM